MKEMGPNLAARPFANERPVKRTTLFIWILALTLLAVNVVLYQRHLAAHNEQRQTIKDLQEQIQAEEEAVRRGRTELAALALGDQNDKVLFLNGQIARRTFSWSQLFNRLEEVLPANVDLQRVSPKVLTEQSRSGGQRGPGTQDLIAIDMKGEAQTGEELLQLLDNLFDHASFISPDLAGENERTDGGLEFTLKVLYLPSAVPDESAEVPEDGVEEGVLLTDSVGGDG